MMAKNTAGIVAWAAVVFFAGRGVGAEPTLVPLRPAGESFVTENGETVRFWGVNLVALFPSHEEAEQIAEHLAERQINLVRPHHLLRPSADWIYRAKGVLALNRMRENTRDADPEAWDRFDYLNAQLRKRGIYLSLSLHFSRNFKPGDADVLASSTEDRDAWKSAIQEMNAWPWNKSIDPFKMLATFDPRAQALQEEFARQLLGHVNPYTGLAYGKDPQVLTLEVVNESSAEYCLICGNTFPAYFERLLKTRWDAFVAERGQAPFDFRKASDEGQKRTRTAFYRSLDEALMRRMTQVVRSTGCRAAVTYSNLWRGENNLEMHAETADFIEAHAYVDPLVVRGAEDVFAQTSRTLLRGKPFILGEFNQSEGESAAREQSPWRTMLPLAASAYGAFNRYAGIVWFAWCHGDRSLGTDGWALHEDRNSNLGDLVCDGMMLDHLRTCGLIFRKGLVAPSREPQTLVVAPPLEAFDYNALMRGKYAFKPGWQSVHAIRKAFGPLPETQAAAEWMSRPAESPFRSDTGEIVRDTGRRQLTVCAPQVEAFSGFLDGCRPAGLTHLELAGTPTNRFATVIAVCADDQPFDRTRFLVLSRTVLDENRRETKEPSIRLKGLLEPAAHESWRVRLTRPREVRALLADFTGMETVSLRRDSEGAWVLPLADWHECEVVLAPDKP